MNHRLNLVVYSLPADATDIELVLGDDTYTANAAALDESRRSHGQPHGMEGLQMYIVNPGLVWSDGDEVNIVVRVRRGSAGS